jgi:hypothetical protein
MLEKELVVRHEHFALRPGRAVMDAKTTSKTTRRRSGKRRRHRLGFSSRGRVVLTS